MQPVFEHRKSRQSIVRDLEPLGRATRKDAPIGQTNPDCEHKVNVRQSILSGIEVFQSIICGKAAIRPQEYKFGEQREEETCLSCMPNFTRIAIFWYREERELFGRRT
jgi:hypothetical protein